MEIEAVASRRNYHAPGSCCGVPWEAAFIVACTWIWSCGGSGEVTTSGVELPGGQEAGPRLNPTPIVFRSDRAQPGAGDLYAMAPDGSGVTRLTQGGDFFLPQWSPNGDFIAFRRMLELPAADVGLVAADGGPPIPLTDGESPNLASRPVNWSPDGQRVAFAAFLDGGLRMSSLARSGGQQRTMLPDLELTALAWSPTEPSRIAYGDFVNRKNGDIWIADPDGSHPTNLSKGRVYSPSVPRWSPDGKKIAFAAYALAPDGSIEGFANHSDGMVAGLQGAEVFVIDIESEVLTRVTHNTADDLRPGWSPDGKSLLYSSDGDGDVDIWLVPLDDPEQARDLIDDNDSPAEDNDPDWDWGR